MIPCVAILSFAVAARAQDPYADAWVAAGDLEAAGQPGAAYDLLVPFRSSYPQDFALALQLGWLAYSAGRFEEADAAYREALALSDGSPDALAGLAWTRLALGDAAGARELAAQLPEDDPRADEIRSRLRPARPWRSGLSAAESLLPPGRTPTSTTRIAASVDRVAAHWSAGMTAGVTLYGGLSELLPTAGDGASQRQEPRDGASPGGTAVGGNGMGNGPGPGGNGGNGNGGNGGNGIGGNGTGPGNGGNGNGGPPDDTTPSAGPWSATDPSAGADLELWGRLGVGGARLGAEGAGALLLQTAPDVAPGFVAGAILRLSSGERTGTLRLESSLTSPRGDAPDAVRVSPSWWQPLGAHAAIEPSAALQRTAGAWLPSAGGTAWLHFAHWGAWAGGRGGPSRNTTWLALSTTAAWPDLERAGVWAGARLGSVQGWWLAASWSAAWLDPDASVSDPGPEPTQAAHTFGIELHAAP